MYFRVLYKILRICTFSRLVFILKVFHAFLSHKVFIDLQDLVIRNNPINNSKLIRYYSIYRFSRLLSFNEKSISVEERTQVLEDFEQYSSVLDFNEK